MVMSIFVEPQKKRFARNPHGIFMSITGPELSFASPNRNPVSHRSPAGTLWSGVPA